MGRLTDRYSDGTPFIPNYILSLTNGMADVIKKLAEYEDLEEQGRLIELPCKVGDIIYQICDKCICTLGHTHLHATCHSSIECTKCGAVKIKYWIEEKPFSLGFLNRVGKDFFATKEEAEAKLKEMVGESNDR